MVSPATPEGYRSCLARAEQLIEMACRHVASAQAQWRMRVLRAGQLVDDDGAFHAADRLVVLATEALREAHEIKLKVWGDHPSEAHGSDAVTDFVLVPGGGAEADVCLASLAELAAEICRRRAALPGAPLLTLSTAQLSRGGAGFTAVSVRAIGAQRGDLGPLIGYAVLPGERPVGRLLQAIAAQNALQQEARR